MASAMNCTSIMRAGLKNPSRFQYLFRAASTSGPRQYPSVAMTKEETQDTVKSVKEMPGPPHWPIMGCAPHMMYKQMKGEFNAKQTDKFFADLASKYGPTFRMESPFFPAKMVVVTRPEDCEAMVRATMDNPTRDGFTSLKKIRLEAVDDYFEGKGGILVENGDEWWRVRSRVQIPMMRSKNVSAYITRMDEVTLDFMDRIAWMQSQYGEMPSDFQMELYKWALESVSLIVLNQRLGCLAANQPKDSEPMKLIQLVNELFEYLNKLEVESQLWKIIPTKDFKILKGKHEEFLRVAERHILASEEAMKEENDPERELTLLETLMLTPGLTRKDVLTLALDMLFAGIDTTSHTLGFTLYLLAKNPEAQTRLQQEVDSVLGDLEGPITSNHLAQLSYLKAVVKESLRFFPLVTGLGRSLDKDLVLGGYLVPKGWVVLAMNPIMGLDESLFPRAKDFLPERWLRDKPLGPIHPYASLPFGAGTRMCIGRRIAEQEMYIFLARVMQRFNVEYHYQDMDVVTRLVSTPSEPLRFNMTERR